MRMRIRPRAPHCKAMVTRARAVSSPIQHSDNCVSSYHSSVIALADSHEHSQDIQLLLAIYQAQGTISIKHILGTTSRSHSLVPSVASSSMYATVSRNLAPRANGRFLDLPQFRGDHRFDLFLPPSYLFGHTLGEGEFATVRFAYNLRTHSYVSIKCFKPRSGQYMMLDEQIMREMMATKGLIHEHIIKTYEAILYGNRMFLVMEYCPYGDLRKYINRTGALEEQLARTFFGQLCLGVQKMHSMDLVHRDLKLENIMIDANFRLKIGDLGCARRQMDKQLHTITGSYAYGAPELVRGDHYDGKKADMWSLGVILFAMVAGKLPYGDKGRLKKMLKDRMRPPEFPTTFTINCREILIGLLCYNPARRLSLNEGMRHPWMCTEDNEETELDFKAGL